MININISTSYLACVSVHTDLFKTFKIKSLTSDKSYTKVRILRMKAL